MPLLPRVTCNIWYCRREATCLAHITWGKPSNRNRGSTVGYCDWHRGTVLGKLQKRTDCTVVVTELRRV